MEDVFNTTISAIRALAPNLRFTLATMIDADNNACNAVDWDSFVIDKSCADMTCPSLEEIENKRKEIVDAEPLRQLRKIRNQLLTETDWWTVPDRTMTDSQIEYRQALRDITTAHTSLDTVEWPTKPLV